MTNAFPRKSSRLLWSSLSVALFMALMAPQRAEAQVLYGSIVGSVTDSTGAVVPGATVGITNKQTNLSRTATTDPAGAYSFIDIQAGDYDVKLTHAGFKTFTKTGVGVTINSSTRVDVVLEVGAVTQTVEVTAAAATLQTETGEVHADVGTTELQNLPVALGRNYQQVYRALPGFSVPQNSHSIPTNPSRALEFNVNGTSDNQNNTRIDGVSTYNIQLPHVNSYVPTLESIQEVNVVTDSFDPEQGFAGGAAINVQTKSGTNSIHGSLFEYNSNNYTKAWPMLFDGASNNVGNKPKFVFNDFGGSAGGPIKKDKLFFFTSYERLSNHRTLQAFGTVPTAAMRGGDLSATSTPIYDPMTGDPVTAVGRTQFVASSIPAAPNFNPACTNPAGCPNIIPTNRLDPVAQAILSKVPLPNRGGVKRDYFVSGPFAFDRNQVDTKINFNATPKLNFIGSLGVLHYSDNSPTRFGPAALGPVISGSGGTSNPGHGHGNTYRTTIMGTYTFSPNFLMDAHFGYAKQGTSSEQPGLGTNIGSDVLGIPGTNGTRRFESGWPEFDFDGFDTIGIDSNFMPYYRHDPQYQYVANFNWIKGTHNLRFGTDAYRQALNHTQAEFITSNFGAQGGFDFNRGVTKACLSGHFDTSTVPPTWVCDSTSSDTRFNSIGSFLLGLPDSLGRALQVPDVYHIYAWLYSAYVRDRWNVSPKLTLDYGLRWEHYPIPRRPGRGIERYDPDPASPTANKALICGVGSVPTDCGIQISNKLFAPRIGLAYRPTNTFVIRAGYGITIDPYEAMELLRDNYPILIQLNRSSVLGKSFPVARLDPSTPSFPSLSAGIPTITAPSYGNGVIDIPLDVGSEGLPKKFNRGYIQSWNFTIQRELKWGFTGQVGYVATNSVRQLGFLDLNAGQVVGGGQPGEPLFADFGRTATTVILTPVGRGHYDSLQASLQRRFTGGLATTVYYTWGKAMNDVDNSDGSPGDEKIQVYSVMNKLNRSATDFDRTHNLELINVWQLPFGKGQRWLGGGGPLSKIAAGWQMNSLASFISGPPFTVYASGNLNTPGSNQTADQVKSHVAKMGNVDPNLFFYDPFAFQDVLGARFGSSGFNILRGPGIVNWDFGVAREFSITERYKLQFRMDSFNFTNTPHFDIPDNSIGDANTVDQTTGKIIDPGSFMTVTSKINLAREGVDERQFEFSLRLIF